MPIDARHYRAGETLRSGLPITIRALHPDDRERMATAVRGLDRDSIYLRFFSYRDELTAPGLDRLMRFEPGREVVLLATTGPADTVIGSARYVATGPKTAEVAFVVEEDYHGQGIASHLLRHLARVAQADGFTTFEADVLPENKAMLAVFTRTGWALTKTRDGAVVHLALALPEAA